MRHLLSEIEKTILRSLCYNFDALLPVYFPKSTQTQKIHELFFHVPRFVDGNGTVGLFSVKEGEHLHHLIKLEAAQFSCVRNDSERLQLIVEQHEQHGQADRSLLTLTRGVRGVQKKIQAWCLLHGPPSGNIIYVCFNQVGMLLMLGLWEGRSRNRQKKTQLSSIFLFLSFFFFWFGVSYFLSLSLV